MGLFTCGHLLKELKSNILHISPNTYSVAQKALFYRSFYAFDYNEVETGFFPFKLHLFIKFYKQGQKQFKAKFFCLLVHFFNFALYYMQILPPITLQCIYHCHFTSVFS